MAGVPTFVRIYRAALSGSSCRAAPLPNPPVSRPLQLARPMSMVPNIPGIPGPPINSSGSISPSGLPVHSEAKMVSGREGVTASGLSLSLQHLLVGGFSPFPRSQGSSRIFRAGDARGTSEHPSSVPSPAWGSDSLGWSWDWGRQSLRSRGWAVIQRSWAWLSCRIL